MGTYGINIAEEAHFVNLYPPKSLNGGGSSDVFSMENYGHATIVIQLGATVGATVGVQVEECDDFTPTTHPGIAGWEYYLETTDSGDTPAAGVTSSSTVGLSLAASTNSFVIIELDGTLLSDGYENVRITIRDPAAATIGAAFAILSGSRYGQAQTPTAIV